ncbi:sodium/proton-translocating pyrophosphatase [Candidatus Woesearchaeota archaeon]|nr:sodium/proton-translocating pyrophosphatase [Candidatus Woesearchaeota archaeon]
MIWIVIVSILALVFAGILSYLLLSKSQGDKKLQDMNNAAHDAVVLFLQRQGYVLATVIVVLAVLLLFFVNWQAALSFVAGALCSGLACFLSMKLSTRMPSRVLEAAKEGVNPALRLAFSSGTVPSMIAFGLVLFGIAALYNVLRHPGLLVGFGLGASVVTFVVGISSGVFARGVCLAEQLTQEENKGEKKEEKNSIMKIISAHVSFFPGASTGFVQLIGAALIAAMVIGTITYGFNGIYLPLALVGTAAMLSFACSFVVRSSTEKRVHVGLRNSILGVSILFVIASYYMVGRLVGEIMVFYAVLCGVIAGLLLFFGGEWGLSRSSLVKRIIDSSRAGASTTVLYGLASGMGFTLLPLIVLALTVYLSYYFAGFLGIAIAATSLLSLGSFSLACVAYRTVAYTAVVLAEATKQDQKALLRLEGLASSAKTASIAWKIVVGCGALLTILSLFSLFMAVAKLGSISLTNPGVLIGILIGCFLPIGVLASVLSSGSAVAAHLEASKQLKSMQDSAKRKTTMATIDSSAYSVLTRIGAEVSLRQVIVPGLIVVLAPLFVGFVLGASSLGGLLIGALATGSLLSFALILAGGLWWRAKEGQEQERMQKRPSKEAEQLKALAIGARVGHGLSGAANQLVATLMLLTFVSLLIAPLIVKFV